MTTSSAHAESPAGEDLGQVLVIIPTYNELENVRLITERVRRAVPDAHILIADDNSPDGTGAVADELVKADDHVHVLHRLGKEGLAAAYMAGFAWGLERGYGVLVEMDADGSHQPEQLPRLLAALQGADLVLGSRWVPGGSVENWPMHRKFLSRGGNLYTRLMLDLGLKDATGGYRAFRASTLRALQLHEIASQGYCFQVDMARRVVDAGMTVVEVPITFVEREYGTSKMNNKIVTEALWKVTLWGAGDKAGKAKQAIGKRRALRKQLAAEKEAAAEAEAEVAAALGLVAGSTREAVQLPAESAEEEFEMGGGDLAESAELADLVADEGATEASWVAGAAAQAAEDLESAGVAVDELLADEPNLDLTAVEESLLGDPQSADSQSAESQSAESELAESELAESVLVQAGLEDAAGAHEISVEAPLERAGVAQAVIAEGVVDETVGQPLPETGLTDAELKEVIEQSADSLPEALQAAPTEESAAELANLVEQQPEISTPGQLPPGQTGR